MISGWIDSLRSRLIYRKRYGGDRIDITALVKHQEQMKQDGLLGIQPAMNQEIASLMVKRLANFPHEHPPLGKTFRTDAGYDLYVNIRDRITVEPNSFVNLPTGIAVKIPSGYWVEIRPRSSTFFTHRLLVHNGTIDTEYVGPIYVGVYNPGPDTVIIPEMARLAQIVIHKVYEPMTIQYVEDLPQTGRADRGFGSSGI